MRRLAHDPPTADLRSRGVGQRVLLGLGFLLIGFAIAVMAARAATRVLDLAWDQWIPAFMVWVPAGLLVLVGLVGIYLGDKAPWRGTGSSAPHRSHGHGPQRHRRH